MAWKLQMEEQYYENLYNQREGHEQEHFEYTDDEGEPIDGAQYPYPEEIDLTEEDNLLSIPHQAHPIAWDEEEEEQDHFMEGEDDVEEENGIFESYEELLQLSELIPPVSRGVAEHQLAAIRPFTMTPKEQEEHEQCHVCLEDFEVGDACRLLPCAHAYHQVCIDHWLGINKICPLCRSEVVSE